MNVKNFHCAVHCLAPVSYTHLVVFKKIIPDDGDSLTALLCELSDEDKADLILTTGGTGFSKRDNTPEATMRAVERETPGISEAMRCV